MFKFSCEKALLSAAIGTVSRAVAAKSSIPALEGILVTAGERVMLTGYDLETGIKTSFPGNIEAMGSAVLDTRLFGDIVRRMPDDIITVTCGDDLAVTIESGISCFHLTALDAGEYPALNLIQEDDGISIKQNLLKSMIGQTLFAVSENMARPIHTGSLFDVEGSTLTVVSVDGYRLALRREELDENDLGDTSFVVPGKALNEVERICSEVSEEIALIKMDNKYVMFHIDDTILVSRRLEGDFLNYKKAIPRQNPTVLTVDRRALIAGVERVALIISDKLKSPVRCKFEDGLVKLNTSAVIGTAYDECPVEGDGGGLEIGFNDRYLLDALKNANVDRLRIELNTGVSPCILVPAEGEEKFVYMVLPVRLR